MAPCLSSMLIANTVCLTDVVMGMRDLLMSNTDTLVMGRCRFFKSVSVFGFLYGFLKVSSVFSVGFREYRDIGIGFFDGCFLNS
jgi:hypothetical protein